MARRTGAARRWESLLRVSAQLFAWGAFIVLAAIGLSRGQWYGWLFLALALLHASIVVVRLRRMYR
jgi:hypothetical protein